MNNDSPLSQDLKNEIKDNNAFLEEWIGDPALYGTFQHAHAHSPIGLEVSGPVSGEPNKDKDESE